MAPLGLVAFLLFVVAAPAYGYVRTTTKRGAALRWRNDCIGVVVHAGSPPRALTTDLFLRAANAGAAVWSRPGLGCSNVLIEITPSMAVDAKVANDGVQNVTFRRDPWCRDPPDPDEDPCYPPEALAITTVFAQERDGVILDSDIEINAKHFVWDDLLSGSRPAPGAQDLQNTLAHEFGHVIGFDHTCHDPRSLRPRPTDHAGNAVPDCNVASAEIKRTTMYAEVIKGDTERRDLDADDTRAVCDVYPAITPPRCLTLEPPAEEGGCACGLHGRQRRAGVPWWLVLPALAVLVSRVGAGGLRSTAPDRGGSKGPCEGPFPNKLTARRG